MDSNVPCKSGLKWGALMSCLICTQFRKGLQKKEERGKVFCYGSLILCIYTVFVAVFWIMLGKCLGRPHFFAFQGHVVFFSCSPPPQAYLQTRLDLTAFSSLCWNKLKIDGDDTNWAIAQKIYMYLEIGWGFWRWEGGRSYHWKITCCASLDVVWYLLKYKA